jgi:hypothetical protein
MKFLGRLAVLCVSVVAMACAVAATGDDFGGDGTDGGGGGGGDGASCTSKCNNMCTDLKTDNANCGVCGKACPSAAMCTAGQCKCPATDGGSAVICGDQCVDTKTDPNNCGQCGLKCGAEGGALTGGGTWTCTNGACNISCGMPKMPCVPFGCFDLQVDNTNCGSCGNDCGGNLCLAGNCCNTGEINCMNACTNTQTDPNNCGMCGTKCATTCTMGKCCSAPPKGNCAHLPCAQGAKLSNNCDGVGCVAKVCAADSYCCSILWDGACVSEVDTYCAPTYKCSC